MADLPEVREYQEFVLGTIRRTVRAQLMPWHEERVLQYADDAIAALEAENERLRATIRRIDTIAFNVPRTGDPDTAVMDICRIIIEHGAAEEWGSVKP
jgi:hypothetical protein